MTGLITDADSTSVLAVLVLFGRTAKDSASWNVLEGMINKAAPLKLTHCIIHDNSPQERAQPTYSLPERFELHHSRENVGTAGAYTRAVDLARAQNCEWLLLLDQDTTLPSDYLESAAKLHQEADIMVPRVWHCEQKISPSVVTRTGMVKSLAIAPSYNKGWITAISSGMLVRVSALESSLPFPKELWLDYVDHWMFLSFARNGFKVVEIDSDIHHDLSIKDLAKLQSPRLENILRSETALYRHLNNVARIILPLRQVIRGLRYLSGGRSDLAITLFRYLFLGRSAK